jgi:hypothetical protein
MESLLTQRENLQKLVRSEWENYNRSIGENKPFHEIKVIYLRIKELEEKIIEVTNQIHEKLKLPD